MVLEVVSFLTREVVSISLAIVVAIIVLSISLAILVVNTTSDKVCVPFTVEFVLLLCF